jgi:thiamine monophosphate synthase
VGCKDIGLGVSELRRLFAEIREDGRCSYLEVVSSSREATLRSARVALELTPDYVIGGPVDPIQGILKDSGIKFYPYVGQVVDHPCLLQGSVDEIVEDTRIAQKLGVDGINLLAYRYDGDVAGLVRSVRDATTLPLLCAGSVNSEKQIRELARLDVDAFTIGTALLDGVFAPGKSLEQQVETVLRAVDTMSDT